MNHYFYEFNLTCFKKFAIKFRSRYPFEVNSKNWVAMKIRVFYYIVFSLIVSLYTPVVHAQSQGLDPRAKAVGVMALYGTTGGAMLGVAAVALGSSGRSIAKGASLGLYTGLLFGSYIVLSHYFKTNMKYRAPVRNPDERYYEDDEYSWIHHGSHRKMAKQSPALFHLNFFTKTF